MNKPLKLNFDKGTILLSGSDLAAMRSPEIQKLFIWDDRVRCLRSCASNYTQVVRWCQAAKLQIEDEVLKLANNPLLIKTVSLRPYQETAVLNWKLAGNQGIVCLPTGAGKTRVAIAAIAETKVNTICIVPTRVLLEQWQNSLREFYDGPIGVIGDNQNNIQPLTLATFESAYRKMSWLGNRFQLLVIDECHHFGQMSRDELFLMTAASLRLGLTATKPKDPDQIARLEKYIGPVVHEMSLNELVGSFLAPFDLVRLSIRLTPVEQIRYQREYSVFTTYFRLYKTRNPQSKWRDFMFFAQKSEQGKRALSAYFRTRRMISLTVGKRSAARKILERHKGEKIIVFTTDTESAYALSREFLVMPITADIKRKERERALASFKAGAIKVLVSCKVLNEGVDVPDAAIAIIVGGTAVEREYVQRIGRILRPSPKKRAVIYELIAKDTHEERHAAQRRHGLNNETASSGKAVGSVTAERRLQFC